MSPEQSARLRQITFVELSRDMRENPDYWAIHLVDCDPRPARWFEFLDLPNRTPEKQKEILGQLNLDPKDIPEFLKS
jgi:hypothetical protein